MLNPEKLPFADGSFAGFSIERRYNDATNFRIRQGGLQPFGTQELPRYRRGRTSKMLADAGLNPDQTYLYKGLPYQYGSAWLKEELPAEVIAEVESWFTSTTAEPEIQTACV